MAIITYDNNPELSVDEKLMTLCKSVQLALDEFTDGHTTDQLNVLINKKIKEKDMEKYDIGCLVLNVTGKNPAMYLGFGKWVEWGSGRVPVGVNTEDELFKVAEKEGGYKDSIVVEHSHEIEPHDHEFSLKASDSEDSAHQHTVKYHRNFEAQGGGGLAHLDSQGLEYSWTSVEGEGKHTHKITGEIKKNKDALLTETEGEDGTNRNIQPYITCYIFKRVA